jgi:hypothetical protein
MAKGSILADPCKVAAAIAQAAEIAERKGVPCTMARVASCLGIDLSTLSDLANGKVINSDAHPDSVRLIKKASLAAQADIIDAGFTVKNWAFCIYAAKSMHNLQDRPEGTGSGSVTIIINDKDVSD